MHFCVLACFCSQFEWSEGIKDAFGGISVHSGLVDGKEGSKDETIVLHTSWF